MKLNKILCILQAGLTIRHITRTDFEIIKNCTHEEWTQLIELARKQGVDGVFFDGLQEIYATQGDFFPNEKWAIELKTRLLGISLLLEKQNKKQIEVINKVAAFLNHHGCQMMVMKGQACAILYPRPQHRSVGDIDCYLYGNYEKGNKLIRQTGVHVDDSWYKHSEFCIEGETFENHQYFVTTRGGRRYKQLNAVLKELVLLDNRQQSAGNAQGDSINAQFPPLMFNALFLTYHAFIHFVSEGLRLKQVLDWVMFVKAHQEEVDWKKLHEMCEVFKLDRFLRVMNAITVKVFGVEKKASEMICESPYIQKVLDSILYDDDYIFNTGKGNFIKRFHIISNMFKYRWKYQDIAEENIIRVITIKMIGLLFKTE